MQELKHHFKPRAQRKPRHRSRRKARCLLLTTAAFWVGTLAMAYAQAAPARPQGTESRHAGETREARFARWKSSFNAFAEADRQHAPVPGGVLFVGSSSIRLWDDLEQDFGSLPVVTKRGFGGSRLSDCSDHVARLVLPYRPALIVVYAGDNDLADGATPQEVLASFRAFVDAVREELPDTRIAYLSIKPSPLRVALLERARETNALIAEYSAGAPNLDYIDIYTKMLDAAGQPRRELFGPDLLHLSRAGYALWRAEISAHLSQAPGAPAGVTADRRAPPSAGGAARAAP